jgi:predicted nucleic acid-binding protein
MVAKIYFPEPESDLVQQRISTTYTPACSELLLTEFASVASRKLAESAITARQQTRVLKEFSSHVEKGHWVLLPCTRDELVAASDVIRQCQKIMRLRSLDAIHLATCLAHQVFPLFTTDKVMLQAAQHLKIPTEELQVF